MKFLYGSIGLYSLLIVSCATDVDYNYYFFLNINNQTDYKVEIVNKVEEGEGHRRAILPKDSIILDEIKSWPMMYPHNESRQYLRFEFYSDPVKCYDFTESNMDMGPYGGANQLVKKDPDAEYYRYTITDTLFQLAGSCDDPLFTTE